MERILRVVGTLGLGLAISGAARADDTKHSKGKNSPQTKSSTQGNPKNFTTCKYGKCFNKSDFCWTHSCHSSRYGCNCYWFDGCWYVYYQPFRQYIPYTYYVTLASPVVAVTPAATQTTVTTTSTAVAVPVAPAGAGPVLPKPATSGPLPGPGPQ